MKKSEISALLTDECAFFQKLPQGQKKKFIRSVFQLLRSEKIIATSESPKDQNMKVKCAAICAQLFYAKPDPQMKRIFRYVELMNHSNIDTDNERLSRYIIPVRANSRDFWQSATYDIVYGYYHCYLKHEDTLSHFADHAGKVEMLMIDRFEFQKTFYTDQHIVRSHNNSLSMFALVCEQFFNHPDELSVKDPELFTALTQLWGLNPLTSKLMRSTAQSKGQSGVSGNRSNTNQLHWVYHYTLISVFAGSILLWNLLSKTVVLPWMIVLLMIIFSLNGIFLVPVFKKYSIPVFKIPYLFFSAFGLGVNSVALLLLLNISVTNNETGKTLIFPYSEEKITGMRFPETGNNEYDASLRLKPGIQKNVTFGVSKETSPKFFIIELQKGLLGFYVINNKYVISE